MLRRCGVRELIRKKENMSKEAYERGLYSIPAPTPTAAAAACFSAAQRATLGDFGDPQFRFHLLHLHVLAKATSFQQ